MSGIFITLEGIDGSGKSTQALWLAQQLNLRGWVTSVGGEPGATPIGRQIARILLDPSNQALCPMAEMLLYAADRAQHVREIIRPALDGGQAVICTRFTDSTLAYQCWGRGLPYEQVLATCLAATEGLLPDLTILLDMAPSIALGRTSGDRLEAEGIPLQEKVRAAYLALAALFPQRFRIVPAEAPPEEVFGRVWYWVERFLGEIAVSRGAPSETSNFK